jgi:hypothetical protein
MTKTVRNPEWANHDGQPCGDFCLSPKSGVIADMLASTLSAITGREQMQQTTRADERLLDHLVGEREQFGGKFNAERLSGL